MVTNSQLAYVYIVKCPGVLKMEVCSHVLWSRVLPLLAYFNFYISFTVFCIFNLLIKYKIHSKSISNSDTKYIQKVFQIQIQNTSMQLCLKYKIRLCI